MMAYANTQPKQPFTKKVAASIKASMAFAKTLLVLAKKVCML